MCRSEELGANLVSWTLFWQSIFTTWHTLYRGVGHLCSSGKNRCYFWWEALWGISEVLLFYSRGAVRCPKPKMRKLVWFEWISTHWPLLCNCIFSFSSFRVNAKHRHIVDVSQKLTHVHMSGRMCTQNTAYINTSIGTELTCMLPVAIIIYVLSFLWYYVTNSSVVQTWKHLHLLLSSAKAHTMHLEPLI